MILSVIILNYNVKHFLILCLKSVQAAIKPLEAEVIVVDNDSNDDSLSMVKRKFPNVIGIQNEENLGFSKGNNIGVKQAKGKYICILNPDTIVAEDTFTQLIKFAEKQKKIGAIGCQLIDGKGMFLPESKRNIPTPKIAFQKLLGKGNAYYANHIKKDAVDKVCVLPGAFMFMKKDVYNKVGGFDEAYFMYGEDIDLSYKLLKSGYLNFYFGKAKIIHFKGESTFKDKHYAKRFYRAMYIFYQKHFTTNIITSNIVAATLNAAILFSKNKVKNETIVKRCAVISKAKIGGLETVFNKPVCYINGIIAYVNYTNYILDNNYLDFKTIIQLMADKPLDCMATFRILPQHESFLVGSNSSKHQGDIIYINRNNAIK